MAASATVVQTVEHPAKSISFCGGLYKRSYMTSAPNPGSHWETEMFTKNGVILLGLPWQTLYFYAE